MFFCKQQDIHDICEQAERDNHDVEIRIKFGAHLTLTCEGEAARSLYALLDAGYKPSGIILANKTKLTGIPLHMDRSVVTERR